jgi:hypothetical protein
MKEVNMAQDERAQMTGISLYPTDRSIVECAMRSLHRKSFSDAVQFIIRDWAALKAELEGEPIKPTAQAQKA